MLNSIILTINSLSSLHSIEPLSQIQSLVAGLQLKLNGMVYGNNAPIFITNVGEADSEAVLCGTDLESCCTGQGEWIYPNGFTTATGNSLVRNRPSNDDIFRSRGDMVVRLHRMDNVVAPTGQYCCEVATMDNPDIDSTICIILSKFH